MEIAVSQLREHSTVRRDFLGMEERQKPSMVENVDKTPMPLNAYFVLARGPYGS